MTKRKKLLVAALIFFVSAPMALEIALRLKGFASTPRIIRDATIEYLYAPDQRSKLGGRLIAYNAFSMRSDYFSREKWVEDERRILVIGDSVINGGLHTDQSELATELLKKRLQEREGSGTITVGNISAGSWGPANQLAYFRKYGSFDADLIIAVWSSGDVDDVPLFGPMLPAESDPSRFALGFIWQKVLQRVLGRHYGLFDDPGSGSGDARDPQLVKPLADLARPVRELMLWAKESGIPFVVVRHPIQGEDASEKLKTHRQLLEDLAAETQTPIVEFMPYLAALPGGAITGYRDDIHLNASGQRALAECLVAICDQYLEKR